MPRLARGFVFVSTKAGLVRESRQTFGAHRTKAPSGRELDFAKQKTEGERVTIKLAQIPSNAGSFRQPSAATFLPEEGYLPPDSTLEKCNTLYFAGARRVKKDRDLISVLLL